jgi:hypothetical protein
MEMGRRRGLVILLVVVVIGVAIVMLTMRNRDAHRPRPDGVAQSTTRSTMSEKLLDRLDARDGMARVDMTFVFPAASPADRWPPPPWKPRARQDGKFDCELEPMPSSEVIPHVHTILTRMGELGGEVDGYFIGWLAE